MAPGDVRRPPQPVDYAGTLAWSPDGRYLAWGIGGDYAQGLKVLRADEVARRGATAGAIGPKWFVWDVRWAPTGERLAVIQGLDASLRPLQLWTVRRDGTDARQISLPGEPRSAGSWTPDGVCLVVTTWNRDSRQEFGELMLACLDGKSGKLADHAAADPVVSPDGTTVAFSSPKLRGSDILTMDMRTKAVVNLTGGLAAANRSPQWLPTGRDLVFDSTGPDRIPRVYRVDTRSRKLTLLVSDARLGLLTPPP